LNGIAEIRSVIEKADEITTSLKEPLDKLGNTKEIPMEDVAENKEIKPTSESWKLNLKEDLKNWIIGNNVIEKILDKNIHAEVVKRSLCIFVFLGKQNAITPSIVRTLWNSQEKRDEDVVKAICDTINGILVYLPQDIIFTLCDEINKQLSGGINEGRWEFLRNFTMNALKAYYGYHPEEVQKKFKFPEVICMEPLAIPTDKELCFTNLFWKLSQDEFQLNPMQTLKALNYFKQILGDIKSPQYLFRYLHFSLENAKRGISVVQSLDMAVQVLKLVDSISKEKGEEWKQKFNDEYDLVALAIDSCQHYESLVSSTAISEGDIPSKVFVGRINHFFNLYLRFNFLENILKIGTKKIQVGKSNIEKLCKIYIDGKVHSYDTRRFLVWLSWDQEILPFATPIFTYDDSLSLFNIICERYEKLLNEYALTYYKCFAKNLAIVNILVNSIEYRFQNIWIKNFSSIIGIDQTWKCVCYCSQEETRIKFIELLLSTYINFHSTVPLEERNNIIRNFIDECFRRIEEAGSNSLSISNIFKLLVALFNLVEGKKYDVPTPNEQLYVIHFEDSMGISH
jgi:hypothetical protein